MTLSRHHPPGHNGASEPRPLAEELRRSRAEARAIGSELGGLADEFRELARREVALAQAEVQDNLDLAKRGAMLGAIGAVTALLALVFLALAAVYALSLWLPAWAAALVVGVTLLALATASLLVARSYFSRFSVTPQRTLQSLREDTQWAREQIKRNGA